MRELKSCDNNALTLNDSMGGGQVVLYYRTPTTVERVKFTKSQVKRSGNKISSRVAESRLNSGFNILTGIRKGDFTFDGVVISSTPGEEGYRADWKNLIYQSASDLLMILGQQVFEGEQALPDNIEFEDDTLDEPEFTEVSQITGGGSEVIAPSPPQIVIAETGAAEGDEAAPLVSSQISENSGTSAPL